MPSSTFFNLPQEKQEKLLEAATREFSQRPYNEASINQIIKDAGIPRGSFYMYFTDKEELFRYVLSGYVDQMVMVLEEALLREHGWQVGNVDATVVAQAPKLAPYIPEMRRRLAEAMGLDVDCVSVKATTEERLGFTGSGEGMAAHAVALIERLN